VFEGDKLSGLIKHLQVQLVLAVALAEYLKSDQRLTLICDVQLKSLMFSVHQNYLMLCDLVYHKLPSECTINVFLQTL
jgi:hypothetical protein